MKRIVCALLAAAAVGLSTAPASAQWGPPGGGYGYGPPGGYGGRQRDFDDERPRSRRRDFEDERPRSRPGPAYGQGNAYGGQSRMGSICVTPRGNCAVGGLAPSGSACGCPVFGARGAVN